MQKPGVASKVVSHVLSRKLGEDLNVIILGFLAIVLSDYEQGH